MISIVSISLKLAWILTIGFSLTLGKPQQIELNKFVCENLDKNFFVIKKCNLTKGEEGRMLLNVQMQPLKSIENVVLKIKIMRKTNKDFRPFFPEANVNLCKFLKDYKRQIPWGIIYDRIAKYTNVNHSCPYEHDIIINDFIISANGLSKVPLPKGEYLVDVTFSEIKNPKAKFQIFLTRYF